jgi:hypothetical protein
MSEVKRINFGMVSGSAMSWTEPTGEYVRYEDYERLQKKMEQIVKEIPRLYTQVELADKTYDVIRIAAYEGEEEGLPCVRVTLTLMDKEKSS